MADRTGVDRREVNIKEVMEKRQTQGFAVKLASRVGLSKWQKE